MKGRTTCPKCNYEFVLSVSDDKDTTEVVCPNCDSKFKIKTSTCSQKAGDECTWEEHGEPRKTILSSIKPHTNKPIIAAILLICVFSMGVTTAVFSESFIESSAEMLSYADISGTAEFMVTDELNNSLEGVTVTIDDASAVTVNGNCSIENVTLGITQVTFSYPGYKTEIREVLIFPFVKSGYETQMEEGSGEKQVPFDKIGCSVIISIFSVYDNVVSSTFNIFLIYISPYCVVE